LCGGDWWFLKVIQRWSRQHGATSVKANYELSVTASLDIAGGKIGGQVPWSKWTKKHMQIGDTRWEQY